MSKICSEERRAYGFAIEACVRYLLELRDSFFVGL